jgi:N-acyl-D-aspartate/D-glutamate deacylase
VPGTFADRRELAALADPLGSRGAGVFQAVPFGAAGEAAQGFARDLDDLVWIGRRTGRPVSVALTQARQYPDEWQDSLARVTAATREGVRIVPQVAPRAIGILLSLETLSPLLLFPAAGDLLGAPAEVVRAHLKDSGMRARLAASLDPDGEIMAGLASLDRLFVLESPGVLSYETTRARSVIGRAAARGVSPGEVILEALVASDLRALFLIAIYNWDLDVARHLLCDPRTVPGLGDAGAHTSQTCDFGVPTFLLAYWVRHRGALALETAVRKLTFEPASLWGLRERGLVQRGWFADLNVIDLDALDLGPVEVRHDLPGGAVNLSQGARGYRATIVNGRVLMRDGVATEALPGRVLRGEGATS